MKSSGLNKSHLVTLIAKVALGNRAAFDEFYQLTSAYLFGVLLRLLKDEAVAEEILQDVYIKVWQKAGNYRSDKAAPITWLTTLTRNLAIDYLRQQNAITENTDTSVEQVDQTPGPQDFTLFHQSRSALYLCLEQLQTEVSQCIVMAYRDGYTHEELSSRMNSPLGTVKSWIRRGLEKLKHCLEPS